MMSKSIAKKLKIKTAGSSTQWTTAAGSFQTSQKCKIDFVMPELSSTQKCMWEVHLKPAKVSLRYDMIIGRDLLRTLGIQLNFNENVIRMANAEIPMRPAEVTELTACFIHTLSKSEEEFTMKHEKILDSKYKKADLQEVVNKNDHLSPDKKAELLKLLRKFEPLFDGTLGKYTGKQYDIELKDDAKPYHSKPYTVPHAYEQTFRKEVERLCDIGVLRRINRSEWAAGTFLIPKKNHTVRFITDFRELNKRIRRRPYPIPKNTGYATKTRRFHTCLLNRPKYGLLSHRIDTSI